MLTGYIRGQELRISTPEIAADSIKYLEAEFHFAGRDWDGYVKTAYFINGASKFALVLADDRITADMGLNLTAGEREVKLSGVKGDSRITTTTEHVYVRKFGSTDGTLPDVTPTQAEQLLAKIGDMAALETEAKDSLVSAINEAAKSGGGGSGGKDGTGIESITYKGEDESGGNMYTVLLTDGTSYDITAPKGAAGITPHIGDNGNWYLGKTDTGKPSRGEAGLQGPVGPVGPQGPQGEKGEDATADPTLGLTGATVGQIAKITAVDESGVPTAWEPVDMPSGGGETNDWTLLADITLTEDSAVIKVDKTPSGGSFSIRELAFFGGIKCDTINKTLTLSMNGKIGYGNPTIELGQVLNAAETGTESIAAYVNALPGCVFSRTQHYQYNSQQMSYNTPAFSASALRNESQVASQDIGNPLTVFAIAPWTNGKSGVFKAGTSLKFYGR